MLAACGGLILVGSMYLWHSERSFRNQEELSERECRRDASFIPTAEEILTPEKLRVQYVKSLWEPFARPALRLAGANAVDCGIADALDRTYSPNRVATDACVVAAFKKHKPLRALYRWRDKTFDDEFYRQAVIGTSKGHIHLFWIKQIRGTELLMAQHLCKHPRIVTARGKQRLMCQDKHVPFSP
jgi:hypothetical protein